MQDAWLSLPGRERKPSRALHPSAPLLSGGGAGLFRRIHRRRAALHLLFSLSFAVTAAFAQTYSNPLATPAFPPAGDGCCGPADPCIIEVEGTYYIYPTGEGWGYKVMASDDLVHWTGDAIAFAIPSYSPWKRGSAWAPDVERIGGKFYMYYTAGGGGLEGQHIGVAEASSPWGPFIDRSFDAPLIPEIAIDAECFQDNGELYLYYVRLEGGRLNTWIRRLSDPLTLAAEPGQLCISGSGWEATVNEGPSVFKRDGKYYMLYSGNYAHTADYGIGLAVADHPLGPWVKQPAQYNPLFSRNDAIELYGPGHGHNIVGPDGLTDWYVYHHKIDPTDTFNGGLNYRRWLALDRLVPVARYGSRRLRFTSSGGTTAPTLAPRRATLFSNFELAPLPLGMASRGGTWSIEQGRLVAPVDGELEVDRPLSAANLQDFVCEWWLRVEPGYTPVSHSAITFAYGNDVGSNRLGFRIRPGAAAVEFGQSDGSTDQWTTLASSALPPTMDWAAFSRRITITRQGSLWRLLIDREPVAQAIHAATLGPASWITTTAMPCTLDGYRCTAVFDDGFECGNCTADRWAFSSGQWSMIGPTANDDGSLRQADTSAGMKFALCNTIDSGYFDLGADFRLIAQLDGNGRFPKHGLVHSYSDPQNFAMVFIDAQYEVVATNAVIGGVWQQWVNAAGPLPATYAAGGYRRLSAANDISTGEFVYSLNGEEMMRRAYPTLPPGGRTGLVSELSEIVVDNFRVSHALPMSRIALDRTTIAHQVHIGTHLSPDTVLISNSGQGTLLYQFSDDADWLDVQPVTGEVGGEAIGEADPIEFHHDFSGLVAGTYVADVAVVALSCDNSPRHIRVEVRIDTIAPDFDGDGDVDQSDFSKLQACFTELISPPVMPPGCESTDLDGDGRVMASDFELFQACFQGPGSIPPPTCLP